MLTPDPDDYVIRAETERTLGVRPICDAAVTQGDADISASAMEHAVTLFFKEMRHQLCDGFSVNTGWFTAGPHVRSIAKSPREQYDKEKHTLLFEFHQGATLRRELASVTVEILGVADTGAVIAQDYIDRTKRLNLSPLGIAKTSRQAGAHTKKNGTMNDK
jgi:hypothetical protein